MVPSFRPAAAILAALVAFPALAGCFGGEAVPVQRAVGASGGKVSEGWAYDGAGLMDGGATLAGSLDNEANAGTVTVAFTYAGRAYEAVFDQFAESKPFQDGGVVFNLDEHGDTGVADASIPRIHALVAAWGTAKVTRDGQPVSGKAGELWAAHLMVSRDTVRGADGKILNEAGAAPYDPAKPGDARRVENDPQALFFVKHPDGETAKRAPVTGSATLAVNGPDAAQTTEVPAEAGAASVTVNVTIAPAAPAPVPVGQVAIRILDANGTLLAGQGDTPLSPNQPASFSFPIEAMKVTGPLTVEVSGSGAFAATVDHAIAYDDHPFLVVTWDDVTVS